MRGRHPLQTHEEVVDAPGKFAVPALHQFLDFLPLQIFSCAAKTFGGKRVAPQLGELLGFILANVGERPDDRVFAVVASQDGRHGLEAAAVKEVQKEGADDVVHVVPQCTFV